jgi:hypothetical protein
MTQQLTMNKTTFYGSIALAAVLAFSIGTAGGGGFAMRQANATIDAIRTRDNEDIASLRKNLDEASTDNVRLQTTLFVDSAIRDAYLNRYKACVQASVKTRMRGPFTPQVVKPQ